MGSPQTAGWSEFNMLDLINYEGGAQPPSKDFVFEPRKGYVRLCQIRDFGDAPKATYVPDTPRLKKFTRDDLLLARYGGGETGDTLGRICTGLEGAYNVALVKLIFDRRVLDARFVKYLFKGPWFSKVVSRNSRSCQTGFNRQDLEEVVFPYAPIEVQRAISGKLDRIAARLEDANARLDTIPAILKRFRMSVLAAACSGRLTEDWRRDQGIPADVADSWGSCDFGDLIVDGPQNGLYKPASAYGEGTIILRIDSFYDGQVRDWVNLKRLTVSAQEQENFALANGDIVVNRVNSMAYLGKSALVRNLPEPCVFESNMMRMRLDPNQVEPEYVIRYLNSPQGLAELRKNAKHAVNQSSINQEDVKAVVTALPSIEEQTLIVNRAQALFSEADTIESRYKKAHAFTHKVMPSVLAKAFRGELA